MKTSNMNIWYVRDTYRRYLIETITNAGNGTVLNALSFEHDLLGRITNHNADTFGYNARSEVTSADIGSTASRYAYDPIGNRIYAAFNAETNAYTVNNLNQYTSISNFVSFAPSCEINPHYDADGNMVRLGNHILAYDAENRLSAYTFGVGYATGTLRSAYVYDHLGRRIKKRDQERRIKNPGGIVPLTYWHTNTVTTFVYDGWNLIYERVTHTNGTIQETTYFWGKDLSGTLQGAGGVGGLLYEKRNGNIFIPCYDANGNITAYIDTNGTVRAYRQYDAFGNTIAKGGDMVDILHFWYSTKYLDHDTGLYYYGYRYYSSLLQRWINRDPIEESGGWNLYNYAINNSINNFDMLGLFDLSDAWYWQWYQKYGKILNLSFLKQSLILLAAQINTWEGDDPWITTFLALYLFGDGSKKIQLTEKEVKSMSVEPYLLDLSTESPDFFSSKRVIPETKSKTRFSVNSLGPGNLTIGHFDVYYKGEVDQNCTFKGAYRIDDKFEFPWAKWGVRSRFGEFRLRLFTLLCSGIPFKIDSVWITHEQSGK